MKSKIYLKEEVANKDRKFGSQNKYQPVIVVDKDGNQRHALFTINSIEGAIERADRNEEDMPKADFWESLTGELKESENFSTGE